MQRSTSTSLIPLLILLIFIVYENGVFVRFAQGGKKKVHIPDELDDVVDDEEDEDWKKWGKEFKNEKYDPPSLDPSGMDPLAFQAELMKRHSGPSFGFVKLLIGDVKRPRDKVAEIAMKWTKVLKTGSIEVKFLAVDLSTIMFTMEKGKDITELIEFVLNQPETSELKVGDQIHRKPEDSPVEEDNRSGQTAEDPSPLKEQKHPKDEL
ncbi:hypothetical protein IFM89_035116 [Coptis chinensis]|uniref:LDLR chaperone MESD n=1 Tax=Coptis chinensis TaxID=261450 RepID=A0A835M7T0_9MAGN|nr:hypothetical protein IFM89_035116 [Coptis chinensis]